MDEVTHAVVTCPTLTTAGFHQLSAACALHPDFHRFKRGKYDTVVPCTGYGLDQTSRSDSGRRSYQREVGYAQRRRLAVKLALLTAHDPLTVTSNDATDYNNVASR